MSAYWPAILSIIGGIAVGLFSLVIRRLYKSIDLLFQKFDKQQKAINILMLVAMKDDPESTSLFRALTSNGSNGK